ncbi:CD1375 family protein [Enterococcus sp. AZ103]
MAVVYATLVIKGKRVIDEVPEKIREKVKEILVDMDLPELAGE